MPPIRYQMIGCDRYRAKSALLHSLLHWLLLVAELLQRRYQICIRKMVRPAGIEPAALRSGAARSVR